MIITFAFFSETNINHMREHNIFFNAKSFNYQEFCIGPLKLEVTDILFML
jgi:hypothetical protein